MNNAIRPEITGGGRLNIRIIPPRHPYRALTVTSAYPAAYGSMVEGSYLIIRDDEENSSSRSY